MKYLLARAHLPTLSEYASARVLLAFDFDGTLAPIVKDPSSARMRPETHARLALVAKRFPCVVITGRSVADVRGRLEGIPVVAVVGNHGLEARPEPGPESGREPERERESERTRHSDMEGYAKSVASWRPILEHSMHAYAGVEIEDKRYSLAVHYRKSRKKPEALEALRAATLELGDGVRWVGGKQVVNLVPKDAPDKGVALQLLRDQTQSERAIYVGDDLTDEDVFALNEPGRLLAVRIGRTRHSGAPYYLRRQREIDLMLEALAALREDHAEPPLG
jgi:trehalose 6-phosphate phosphatase